MLLADFASDTGFPSCGLLGGFFFRPSAAWPAMDGKRVGVATAAAPLRFSHRAE